MSHNWISAGLLSLGILAGSGAQAANTLPNGGLVSYSFGGWSVAISNCGLTLAPSTSASTDCSSEQVIGTVNPNGSLTLVYQGLSGALLASHAANTVSDLSFTETVTAPTGVMVSSVTASVTGTGTSLNLDTVFMGVTTPASGTATANATPLDKTIILASAAHSVVVTKDIKSGGLTGTGNLSLNTVTQTFSVVPEPASLSLLMVGVAGLIGLRRRRANRG